MSGKSKLHQLGGRNARPTVPPGEQSWRAWAERLEAQAAALARSRGYGDARSQATYDSLIAFADFCRKEETVDGEGQRCGEAPDGPDSQEA